MTTEAAIWRFIANKDGRRGVVLKFDSRVGESIIGVEKWEIGVFWGNLVFGGELL